MRYELIQLAQLLFALSLMFGAFLGGLAVGWWRWGKSSGSRQRAAVTDGSELQRATPGVFTLDERDDAAIVLTQPIFDTGPHDGPAHLTSPMFADSPQIATRSDASATP